MKRLGFSLLLSLAVFGSVAAQTGSKHVDLKEITDGKFRQVTAIGEMRSLPDGEHYTAMNADKSMIIKYSYRTGNPVDTLFNARKARECTFTDFDGYTISSTGHHILVWRDTESIYRRSTKAVVYDYDVRRNYVKPISDAKGKQMIPTFSPDGRMCAYVRDNNIWIRKFDFDTEVQVTKDGELNKILNGITDWVYEEEFAVTNLMAWSPDSEYLAFVRFDESEVPEYSMQMYGEGLYPGYYEYKYPKAGQKNSKVSVHSYSVVTKDTKEMKVPVEGDFYIPRITFTQNPDQLAIMTLNRHQDRFDLYFADPRSTLCKLILRDESPYYIKENIFDNIQFYPEYFSLLSERDGYSHLYWYSMGGNLIKKVTNGKFEVKDFLGYDEEDGSFYYTSNEESPLRKAVYKIDKKGKKLKLSQQVGTNTPLFSKSMKYYMNKFSNLNTPMLVTLNDNSGKTLKTLITNDGLKQTLSGYAVPQKEFFTFQTTDGVKLNGWMMKPVNFSASKKLRASRPSRLTRAC